jgi:predicted MFS family arabinose efflux permease
MFYPRVVAWSIWMIASLFYAYQYILRVMPNIMMGDITRQFHIDSALFGQFSGVYYIGYSLMHLPIGIMLDRFGPKKVMTGCIMLTVVGLLPILFAEHWAYPIIGRALIGVGSSAAILGTFKIIRLCFQERYFSRMLSFSVMIGLIGAVYGGGPVSYLCTIWGYKVVVELFVMVGLLLAVTTYMVVPPTEPSSDSTSILADVKTIFMNRTIMLLCCFGGLMLGPLEGFSDVWGSGFFQQVYGFNKITANTLPSMIFIGMCFGSPVLSLIAEKTGYYLGTIAISGIIMFTVFSALVLSMLTIPIINGSLILVGVCCAYQILLIYKVSTYAPERLAGLATAVANMVIMIFGYAFHSIIGFVIKVYGGSQDSHAFIYGISVIPLGLLFGVLGCLYLSYKDKYKTNYISYAARV